jgi:para-nitrobenzyl esterase
MKLLFLPCLVLCSQPVAKVPALGSITGSITLPGNATVPSVASFLAIPYAEPPIKKLRWAPPVKHGPWKEPINGTQFGSMCYQPPGGGGSEDCLFLSIYTTLSQDDA